ncbi:MAG: hypothetical protein QG657_5094, partial [Acidobacteriota bacterium]|nr:hypothetical protein [Acidobacteriota bacterium]
MGDGKEIDLMGIGFSPVKRN